jgi:predicted lipoprotein with Yx(FWY)xxD motif
MGLNLLTTRSAIAAGAVALVAIGAVESGTALAAGRHPDKTRAVTIGVKHTALGTVVDAGPKHRTVYMFTGNHGKANACQGSCTKTWLAVTTVGKPRAVGGAMANDLGTLKEHSAMQVTYKGHRLYYHVGDTLESSVTGQALLGTWFMLSPDGVKNTKTFSAPMNPPPPPMMTTPPPMMTTPRMG